MYWSDCKGGKQVSGVTSGFGKGLGELVLLQNSLSEPVSADHRPTSGTEKLIKLWLMKNVKLNWSIYIKGAKE